MIKGKPLGANPEDLEISIDVNSGEGNKCLHCCEKRLTIRNKRNVPDRTSREKVIMGQDEEEQQPPCHDHFGRRWGAAAGFACNGCEEECDNRTDRYWEDQLEIERDAACGCGYPPEEEY